MFTPSNVYCRGCCPRSICPVHSSGALHAGGGAYGICPRADRRRHPQGTPQPWEDIKEQLIADVDRDYGVFDGTTFKTTLFEEYLIRQGIPWPRLPSGRLALDRDTFREMGRGYPIISPLRELKHALVKCG